MLLQFLVFYGIIGNMRTPNPQQLEVINELEENLLLFASAGTGKTFTVAQRVAHILMQGKANAEQILCLTFTIKASNEMKEDILSIVGAAGAEVQVNTIHGFCYRLITEEMKRVGGNYGELSVCDEVDQEQILQSILSSRYLYWKFEQMCKAEGLEVPNLQELEVRMQGASLVWLWGERYITQKGELYPLIDAKDLSFVEITCPVCNTEQRVTQNCCTHCGEPFRFRFQEKEFSVFRKKTGLRNLISEIKHCREEGDFYVDDEVADNQAAYAYLKEKKPTVFEGLTSYYARYVGYAPDEEFVAAMDEFAGRLTAEYDRHLLVSNLLDFDDLILQAQRILSGEEGLAYWSQRYAYIILDEMQDTSRLEYSLLKKLFMGNNVMLCGDFFQTIYGWRGSRPQEILEEYAREFSAKIAMLSVNYRATKILAEASFGYLKNIYPQLIGKYCPQDLAIQSEKDGEKIFCYAFDNREQEAAQIYKYLSRRKKDGDLDVCILARSNKYIAELVAYLDRIAEKEEDGLRFFTVEENFQFFKKPLVKDVLAVIKLLLNPLDRVSMERITEKFVRQVGIKTTELFRRKNEIGVSISAFLDGQTYQFGDPYHRLIEGAQTGNIVVYDTETTGLDLQKDEPVQISAVRLGKNGEITATLDILIEPTVPIGQGAMDTHGFTLEYIRENGGVSLGEALERFAAFVKDSILIGHNNFGYDKPLLSRLLKEEGLPPLQVVAEYDTLPIAKQFYPQLVNYKLERLCEAFGVVNECAHNALGDITATGKCLYAMLREKVQPTAMERQAFLMKYAVKFEKLYAFMQDLHLRLEEEEPLGAYIIDRLLLRKRYSTRADWHTMQDLMESLDAPCEDKRAFLREYVTDAALSGSQMDVLIQKSNKIPVITVHQAKGCEFGTVIIAGADDSNFPSFAAKQSGYEEEEKKIFYVAITRAKERLLLTRVLRNNGHHLDEAPYFWGIPEEYVRVNRAWKNGNE